MIKATIPPLYKHQQETADFITKNPRAFVTSEPGTGKSRSVIEAFANSKTGHMLVICPKSIMEAAWGDDIKKFNPELTYRHYELKNKELAFKLGVDITIMNHDAVKWLSENTHLLRSYDWLVVDESTAFKNRAAKRSKAVRKLAQEFSHRVLLSGTPAPNGICDIWHQALLLDDGDRLGANFYAFRNSVAAPKQVGPSAQMVKWEDKPGAIEAVGDTLRDITIRHKLTEVLDMPKRTLHTMSITLKPSTMKTYEEMKELALLELEDSAITAVNAAVKAGKLLQICTGAVFDDQGAVMQIHSERYDLVIELINQRKHSVVVCNYRHQFAELIRLADAQNITHAQIHGGIKQADRTKYIQGFQKGDYQVMFLGSTAGAHGITLTKADTLIWASPTYDLEKYLQCNGRIFRAGQDKRTEIICIAAKGTIEEKVYDVLEKKEFESTSLLNYLKS